LSPGQAKIGGTVRITFVLPCFDLTGGNRVVSIYADALRRRGHEVSAVAPRQRRTSWRQCVRSLLRGRGWPARTGVGPSHFDGLGVPHRTLRHSGPVTDADLPPADVVVATWWETAEWVAALSPSRGAKVHFMQDYEVWGGPRQRVDATCRLPMPKIVIARWVRDLLCDRFGQPEPELIPNSVDADCFHAPPRGRQAVPTVGLTYTPMHNKGCDISLKAFELAARRLPGLRLVAFGSTRPTPELPLPPGADFTFQAPNHMLREIYARCDAWLFGTRIEGFGLPLLEAMACRTPVIGTPAGAAPELLGQGGGVLVPHEDPAAMAEAIVRICSLPDVRWRELSDRALAVSAASTWDAAADRFEAVLLRATSRKPVAERM
jgi:glycosyltransferase involved in cell wall biosynthesis